MYEKPPSSLALRKAIMASLLTVDSPPTHKPSSSDLDCGSDKMEYEEIEEEIEVEVEVELEIQYIAWALILGNAGLLSTYLLLSRLITKRLMRSMVLQGWLTRPSLRLLLRIVCGLNS